ncbi:MULTISPECIES: DUF2818 family protein [Roseateles]|uniref:DUF2818 family protein n=1 Tax=Roseateles albus TaxID=2987525 RepID=A0ABT5KI46_9BURK|nr:MULTISPECIES: DUF2818 family protein [Roseateles]MCV2360881.1 DUF2818 family protein [Paucibacter sp. TC2R-5]MDC8773194.1 DUF2818 family protein [Roseateles albus]
MDSEAAVWLVLLTAAVAANLPYFSHRLLLVGPVRRPKAVGWRLAELAILACLTLALGFALEARIGQRHPQGWEFYGAAICLFITLGFPGFVWCYLRRGRHEA